MSGKSLAMKKHKWKDILQLGVHIFSRCVLYMFSYLITLMFIYCSYKKIIAKLVTTNTTMKEVRFFHFIHLNKNKKLFQINGDHQYKILN
jgi:hypothetical protein